jgi:hypothetical protein
MGMPKILRRAIPALAFAAAFLAASGGSLAASGSQGPNAIAQKAHLDFAIRIPDVLRLTSISHLEQLVLPASAATSAGARVVEVSDANVFEVVTTLAGYSLQFDVVDPEVTAVDIEGLGQAVQVVGGQAIVRFVPGSSAERRVRRNLTYRIHYANGARPGPRPIPIALSVSAS